MTLRHPMYFIINNVRYKAYESYKRSMCVYQENCSFKIFQVCTMCGCIMYTWNIVTLDRTRVYLFVLKTGNRTTIHVQYVGDKYQMKVLLK